MSNEFPDWRAVMSAWPAGREFADDVGVSLNLVNSWKHRNRIPPEHWAAVLDAAWARGIDLVADDLVAIAERYRGEPAGSN